MNEITKQAVKEASRLNGSLAKEAAQGDSLWHIETFDNHIHQTWKNILFNRYIWDIRDRADNLFRSFYPECYQKLNDDEWYLADEDLEHFKFVPMVERVFQRFIERRPELQLEDYQDYLNQLYPEQLTMF